MAAVLRLVDEVPGEKKRPSGTLYLASERITAREIMRRRLEAEIARTATAPSTASPSLVKAGEGNVAGGVARADGSPAAKLERQMRIASDAFVRNRLVMLLDDRQIENLDEVLTVTPESTVTFLRLVPLVGG